ncbi:MAG: preprotein translocase subunit SecE [Legionellales bacterium]|nr:preprotein translocase subunit SecE [Legionellales bacterium]
MSVRQEENSSKADILKWLAVLVIFALGLYANYHYSAVALPIRIIGWIVVFGVMLGIASVTTKGRIAVNFAKEARVELRKVVWPTRQETMHTAMVVIAIVLVMALIMWAADTFFLWAMAWLTGQRG